MTKTAIIVAACALAVAVSLLSIAVFAYERDQRQADINKAVCTAVVKLDGAITDSLNRSLTNIPKLQYYKDHPDERASQIAEIHSEIGEFMPPPECGGSQGGEK